MELTNDYAERVYAGVLGKVIGVYLGRPFEGWTYQMIQERLGDIEYYVHDKLNVPLIVTDDDISGTFTFLRALEDHGTRADLSSREVGESWLNYLIKERTILWWGGLGNSTEHTAYLRLINGIHAPESGSMALNGKVVAEQIGAQIFIDGWAMVCPGDPDQAVRFTDAAARVSHDGEAVFGAKVLAAMEAMAFVESDVNKLIDKALGYIPTDSVITTMIDDIRHWYSEEKDWRATRERLEAQYGYDKYGGNCHMVPNHGLIIHSLLHGEDDFSETLKIINTCGWDTDCNSGNVGCLMGIKEGLAGIDAGISKGLDWRGPIADRIYLPTADGGRGISDCASEAVHILNMGRTLAGKGVLAPKGGAQFHFSFPGAVQGFQVVDGTAEVQNDLLRSGERGLKISYTGETSVGSPVFAPSKATAKYFEGRGYGLMASPRVFPGQVLEAVVSAGPNPVRVSLYVSYYGEDDETATVEGTLVEIDANEHSRFTMDVPTVAGPIFEIGVKLAGVSGTAFLESMKWSGAPEVVYTKPTHKGSMWRRAWINAVDSLIVWRGVTEMFRLIQNEGMGLIMQGTREWQDYSVTATITPHMAKRTGVASRVQGLTRFYGLLLVSGNRLQLIRKLHDEVVLAEIDFEWMLDETYELTLEAHGSRLRGKVNGETLIEYTDDKLDAGAVGLVIEEGRVEIQRVQVGAVG
ncbi:MAG: ADP-ribosylglycohydrolase family protein [Gammaproteobacteria bacterium]|nr:MAG: ADP-ribosylglycohydrolase family protein [Gammaproteobacteria bacterium]